MNHPRRNQAEALLANIHTALLAQAGTDFSVQEVNDFVTGYREQHLDKLVQVLEHRAAKRAAAPTEVSRPIGILTPWGGERGDEVPPDQLKEGDRYVNEEGAHGVIRKVVRTVWKVSKLVPTRDGMGTTRPTEKVEYDVTGELDNGHEDRPQRVFRELLGPSRIVQRIDLGDGYIQSPETAWQTVNLTYESWQHHDRRKPTRFVRDFDRDGGAEHLRVIHVQGTFQFRMRRFWAWHLQNPDYPLPATEAEIRQLARKAAIDLDVPLLESLADHTPCCASCARDLPCESEQDQLTLESWQEGWA